MFERCPLVLCRNYAFFKLKFSKKTYFCYLMTKQKYKIGIIPSQLKQSIAQRRAKNGTQNTNFSDNSCLK